MFNWNSISLENYAAIDALRRHPASDPIQRDVSILSLLTGKPESFIEEMKLIPDLQNHLTAMHAFLNKPIKAALQKKIKIQGRTFYVGTNFNEWTEAQRRNLAIFTGAHLEDYSMLKITEENYVAKSPELIAILTEEKTRFRKKLNYDEKVELFKQVPASVGMGLTLFFWAVSQDLLPLLASTLRNTTDQLTQLGRTSK